MKILVTGARGFVGKNLIVELRNKGYKNILEYDIDTKEELLDEYCKEAEFVFNLAGVNRPKQPEEFMEGNGDFVATLIKTLRKHGNNCPILLSSSVQAELDNPYGLSKRAGEEILLNHGKEMNTKVFVYRLPNVFGKWCKPNYNSAVATFCNNIASGLPITVNDPKVILNLVYIDDVVGEFIRVLEEHKNQKDKSNQDEAQKSKRKADGAQQTKESEEDIILQIPVVYSASLGEIVELLYSFKGSREDLNVPELSCSFTKKLYSTYLAYLPTDDLAYPLKMNLDERGSFTEFIRTKDRGQVSVNISKPGIVKGNHWHHTKNEKFLVVSGKGVIRFRGVDRGEVIQYFVDGERLQVVDIPPGYTHNIENLGEKDMVTIMWVNEPFDKEKPDTYYLEV
jgi:UDP-2-acetamido-2,6-beta-L-arabino-hexul-4-ose reductase